MKIKDILYDYVKDFIEKNEIGCEESIHQTDDLLLKGSEFMSNCVEIVGYCEYDEENDEFLGAKAKAKIKEK